MALIGAAIDHSEPCQPPKSHAGEGLRCQCGAGEGDTHAAWPSLDSCTGRTKPEYCILNLGDISSEKISFYFYS